MLDISATNRSFVCVIRNRIFRPLCALALWLLALPVLSHEFWIAPDRYQVQPGESLIAHFKNGENFEGSKLAYFTRSSKRFELIHNGATETLAPRIGNIPALETPAPSEGLVIVAHETTAQSLTYTDWAKFQAFADHKDFPDIRARHLARGIPVDRFRESYTRHVKALIAVGSGQGSDQNLGMETEFVALANPYADDMSGGLPIRLLYQGAPRADAQVEVYDRGPDGFLTVRHYRTDETGRTVIPVKSGHEYLLDGVVLRPSPDDAEDVWQTLWAALTFAVP